MSQYLETSVDQRGVATINMIREDVHNAFDDHMIIELVDALASFDRDSSVRLLVLRSKGKTFSAGADLDWMRSMAQKNYQENLDDASVLAKLMWDLNHFSKPTLALVQGAAFGGAVGLIACCDIALATNKACFCLSEVKIGLIPAVISPYVVAAIGARRSRRYMQTAEPFQANQAMQFGLLHEVVEDLDQRAEMLIEQLLANSPQAVAAAKDLVQYVSNKSITPELVDETSRRIASIRVSEEGQEGLNAFLNKREPSWKKT